MSGCIPHLSISHSPVFLVNSCLDLFAAPHSREDPFSRSYGVNLPSSLTVNLPSALVCSTRPRVSVYGTGAAHVSLSGFSRELLPSLSLRPKASRTLGVRLGGWICLPSSAPTAFNALFRQGAEVSTLRPRVAMRGSNGILTVSAIGIALRLTLRTRLTPGRLTLPGKPWSCGEGASHPLCRYLYLHLLFHALQRGSPRAFNAHAMLPYRWQWPPHGFGNRFHTRLLSMQGASTSELLRTL